MSNLVSMQDFAAKVGVSRQAIDQSIARHDDAPKPEAVIGGVRIYSLADLDAWWQVRTENRWKERRAHAERRAIQLNVRIGPDAIQALDKLRAEGETRSAAGARILRRALLSDE